MQRQTHPLQSVHFHAALFTAGLLLIAAVCASPARAEVKDSKLDDEVRDAIKLFQKRDSTIKKFFDESHGYAVFPRVAKGAVGIGGAHGTGEVFEKGELIGNASLSQATIGLQLGGQVFSEIIFFEDEGALSRFKEGQLALSAQVGAVAAAEGASLNAKYENGVAVFTIARNGLMYEASVGGQKFKFKPIK